MFAEPNNEEIIVIKKTLEEDDKRFKNNLQLLEKWMECHSFIPKNYEKEMLRIYLRSCKHNMEKAKKKLEAYFVYKKRYPESFRFVNFTDKERKALDNFYMYESKHLSPEGCIVVCTGFRSEDATGCDFNAMSKLVCMYATYKSNKGELCSGIVFACNLSILSPPILASAVTPLLKRTIEMMQSVYPFRIRGIYMTHLPGYAIPVMNMIKMLFNGKIRKRIIMEAGDEEMRKAIPSHCLPKENGGTDGTIAENYGKFRKILESSEPWFNDHEQVQAVEEIPKKLFAASSIDEDLGTQGSFRQLSID